MNFEVQNALTGLDQRTPRFFIAEMFAQGDLSMKKNAAAALRDLPELTRTDNSNAPAAAKRPVPTSKKLIARISLI